MHIKHTSCAPTFSQPISGRQFQGRTNKRNEKTLTYSWPTVNESIENLHSISNFDNNLARLANNKSDKVAKKCPTKSSILSGPNELATIRHGTCHITNRRDCRFRQFIVKWNEHKNRERQWGWGEGGEWLADGGANQKIIHIELPQQPQQKHTNSNEKLSNESALQFQICSANYYKSFVCWTTYSYSNLHTHRQSLSVAYKCHNHSRHSSSRTHTQTQRQTDTNRSHTVSV